MDQRLNSRRGPADGTRRINGPRLRAARLDLGWTQAEFSRRSGYSERLIRKAEASGYVRVFTLNDLAGTLLEAGLSISASGLTLTCVPPGLTVFHELLGLSPPEQSDGGEVTISDFTIVILRSPPRLRLQREYQGDAGLRRLRKTLQARYSVPPAATTELVSTCDGATFFAALPIREARKPGTSAPAWITAFANDNHIVHLFFT